jgi:Glycosyl hydrolase family 20, catalytic domain
MLPAFLPLLTAALLTAASPTPPIRGLHISAPRPDELPLAIKFISEALPKEGVNVLVLEFDYHYQFTKRPEVAEPGSLSLENVKELLAACRRAGVRLIPQINLLGHQSWAKDTGALLRAHPEFDETPGKYPDNQGIYCRSYCPLHPAVHDVVFDLIDELAEACEADAFHVGMDEVFLIGDDDCPRCQGRNKAELLAAETIILRDHLAKTNRTMWMWGDRLLDGETTGIGKWEASVNKTYDALRLIPRDIMICDWHYERALPTTQHFAVAGFPVLAAPWRRPEVALQQLAAIRSVRTHATDAIAGRMQGVLQTTWGGFGSFAKAYFGETPANGRTLEAVSCFRALFRELRAQMQ